MTFCHICVFVWFLITLSGTFTNLWKTTVSFIMFVRPHGTSHLSLDGFSLSFIYLGMFRKCVEKIQVRLTSDKNNDTLHEDQYTFIIISR